MTDYQNISINASFVELSAETVTPHVTDINDNYFDKHVMYLMSRPNVFSRSKGLGLVRKRALAGTSLTDEIVNRIAVFSICEKVGFLQADANNLLEVLLSYDPDKSVCFMKIANDYLSLGDIFEREAAQSIIGLAAAYSNEASLEALAISKKVAREDADLGTRSKAYRIIDQIAAKMISPHLQDKNVCLLSYNRAKKRTENYIP